jgi:hypothetical protein
MLRRILQTGVIVLIMCANGWAADDDASERRAGLQLLNEFIGVWDGAGGPDKPRPEPKDPVWNETIDWSWRFRGDEAWLEFKVKNGKHVAGGEVRYLPRTKSYSLRLLDAGKKPHEYSGRLEKGYLVFERTDASGETQQLTMNAAGDGARFVYRYAVRPKGRTVFAKVYQVAASKQGESLGAAANKNECIVTGGLGTMAVMYMGETFYVCCTGCRDAFNEEPAKYVKAYKEKKKG